MKQNILTPLHHPPPPPLGSHRRILKLNVVSSHVSSSVTSRRLVFKNPSLQMCETVILPLSYSRWSSCDRRRPLCCHVVVCLLLKMPDGSSLCIDWTM